MSDPAASDVRIRPYPHSRVSSSPCLPAPTRSSRAHTATKVSVSRFRIARGPRRNSTLSTRSPPSPAWSARAESPSRPSHPTWIIAQGPSMVGSTITTRSKHPRLLAPGLRGEGPPCLSTFPHDTPDMAVINWTVKRGPTSQYPYRRPSLRPPKSVGVRLPSAARRWTGWPKSWASKSGDTLS